ncbi:cytosine permease [Adlercreutzia sp. ZJ242]|uniref:cytosine permease n=1 Tax=Adlercreutzia sp. ZJ242 TaxID=2709409 RepID=UPI0013ED7546|nr:cytosine permease [Adlercreutzia sp. ZJ242]
MSDQGKSSKAVAKSAPEVKTAKGHMSSTAGAAGGGAADARSRKASKTSVTEQVSLFERVPQDKRLAWPDIASILSGVVSSLSKLMGGGIVAFYAGCQLGGLAVAITFVLSFVLTYFVGKVCYREGLPNNVVSRFYIFGKAGSAVGSLIWIFVLVGVLAVGTVQLGNAILFAFGWTSEIARWGLFIGISCVWVVMALFGTKIIARMNAVFVVALFCVMGYVVYLIAANGQMADAVTHGILIPGVQAGEGFAYSVNYAIMTSGLLALFAADFTRFARRERDLVPITAVGSLFAIITYICGALITYYGFSKSVEYFSGMGYDATGAAHAAITNPGVSLVLAAGGIGLAIICLSQMKVETSNSIGGANAVSNLVNSLTGHKIPWVVAVVIANAIGLAFILGGILDQVNAFMSYGSILTTSWCMLLITDYYIVRGRMGIGRRGINVDAPEKNVNWRGVGTIAVVTVVASALYVTGALSVPFLLVAPAIMILYILVSWLARDRVRSEEEARLGKE